uniref:Myelin basic protein n=1 Tax=Bursaphelenchus xylophilus TaxID=6326 RepID=A0A1I7SNX9_BURXY
MTSKSVEPEESAPLLGPKKADEVKSIFYLAPSQTQASEEGLHSYTGENDDETKPKSYFNAESAPNSIRSGAEDSEEANQVRRRGRKDKEGEEL